MKLPAHRITPLARRLRLVLPAFAAAAAMSMSAPSASPAPQQGRTAQTASAWRPEVRLRKLHLVRPDLIPYPIAYDVYC